MGGGKNMVRYRLLDGLTKEQRLRKNKIRGRINKRQSTGVDREMGYEGRDEILCKSVVWNL
jgi:hypothetical protein